MMDNLMRAVFFGPGFFVFSIEKTKINQGQSKMNI